jgi:flagellar motor switch protein FliM
MRSATVEMLQADLEFEAHEEVQTVDQVRASFTGNLPAAVNASMRPAVVTTVRSVRQRQAADAVHQREGSDLLQVELFTFLFTQPQQTIPPALVAAEEC